MKRLSSILLIDDDEDDRLIFSLAIKEIDDSIDCQTIENGLLAFEILSKATELHDMIFLDLNMPIMDGFECLKRLKEDSRWSSIPLIIYSTSGYCSDIEKAKEMGASGYLKKPAEFIELCDRLKEIISLDFTNCEYFSFA